MSFGFAIAGTLQGTAAAPAKAAELTSGGLAFMVLSLVFVWVLTLWCFKRVLTTRGEPTDPGPAAKP
jgi:hypothetical protein